MRATPGTRAPSHLKVSEFLAIQGCQRGCARQLRRAGLASSLVLAIMPLCVSPAPSHAALTTASGSKSSGAAPQKSATGVRIAQASGPSFNVGNITAGPGEEVPLQIDLAGEALAQPGVIMIRGLPEGFSLSAGFRTRNSWMVSPKQLENLRLQTPEGYEGEVQLEVIYMRSGGEPGRVENAVITVRQPQEPVGWDQQPTSADPTAPVTASKSDPSRRRMSASVERAMLGRAIDLQKLGDIAGARLIYERMATMGSPIGALNMAKTYDPKVLPALGVVGMKPDLEQARQWYKRAAELGSDAALSRLQAMAIGQ